MSDLCQAKLIALCGGRAKLATRRLGSKAVANGRECQRAGHTFLLTGLCSFDLGALGGVQLDGVYLNPVRGQRRGSPPRHRCGGLVVDEGQDQASAWVDLADREQLQDIRRHLVSLARFHLPQTGEDFDEDGAIGVDAVGLHLLASEDDRRFLFEDDAEGLPERIEDRNLGVEVCLGVA